MTHDGNDWGNVVEIPGWVPEGVDVTVPNAARVYDYALGGFHNFKVDREFKDQAEAAWPGLTRLAHANRAFLGRAVRWLAQAGVHQFLDIGSGIPTLGNVHEVAQKAAPDSRIVYVDIDPVSVAHSQHILADNPRAHAIRGDLRQPGGILYHPDVLQWLDFSEPVAVLLIAVLHFIPDSADPQSIIDEIGEAVVTGSYLALSHGIPTPAIADQQEQVRKLYERTPTPFHPRTPEQVAALLHGWDLAAPALVEVTSWHPDPEEDDVEPQPSVLGAVARKAAPRESSE